MSSADPASVRTCAAAMMAAIQHYEAAPDLAKLKVGLVAALMPVISRPDLHELGAIRKGNHITNTKYLYYDGDLCVTLDEFPKDKFIPPHDHGVWEAILLVKGAMRHTVYERVDNRQIDGHAKLKPAEELIMRPGDIAMVMPPDDIHSFTALEDGTFGITIVGGEYSMRRHYFNLTNDTYVIRAPKGMVRDTVAA